jgi:hypothetical protein
MLVPADIYKIFEYTLFMLALRVLLLHIQLREYAVTTKGRNGSDREGVRAS